MTGEEDGDVTLEAIPALDALLELDEQSFGEFGGALKAGNLAEVVIVRPNEEINSLLILDESVLEDTKKVLNARSESSILKDPSDPYFLGEGITRRLFQRPAVVPTYGPKCAS
ncbi:reverse transcriptase [Plasmopara halstedii]|uniref:Reverse transcriptase n=1 Tax=Plasmopara halstedii TaxID=4781 RepID=A0A0P1B3G8_PLAHL|nr:reverse transcriptase [Plasmopara halstedii]CEG49279.1 reverse transcriptase [Plasmopara halstedii]|eukprot:XP_024585648.1 reverse transcriptase [Plasmopara halstedii]